MLGSTAKQQRTAFGRASRIGAPKSPRCAMRSLRPHWHIRSLTRFGQLTCAPVSWMSGRQVMQRWAGYVARADKERRNQPLARAALWFANTLEGCRLLRWPPTNATPCCVLVRVTFLIAPIACWGQQRLLRTLGDLIGLASIVAHEAGHDLDALGARTDDGDPGPKAAEMLALAVLRLHASLNSWSLRSHGRGRVSAISSDGAERWKEAQAIQICLERGAGGRHAGIRDI